ncbi:hypothetical protein SPI_03757 [Niveomyces insectorum RCEF 264]|uniref:Uncharacterized protein n=1 Tax=Niveomyces insectorum RCEF 264 TaxID=1081102 RepID=A0A167WBV6_9HYPO|nr:hypothetical protein SPI_03757 [Niveomyces insectorum RCEF 264]
MADTAKPAATDGAGAAAHAAAATNMAGAPIEPVHSAHASVAIESSSSDEESDESDHADEAADVVDGLARDPTPYRMRRMPTSATAATAPDEPGAGDPDGGDDGKSAADAPAPSFLARFGLDAQTLKLMFKGSLPPTIGIALFQSSSFAAQFGTVGYLIPIVSVMSAAMMPRGKFLQTLALNLLAVSLGAAVALLTLYSGVQARAHTSGPLTPAELATMRATGHPPYNASQSAVCAIWLVFYIWMINTVRAKLPTFNLPSILFSIFINLSCTFGPLLVTMAQAESLVKRVYTAMLTALALSTGVSLLIFPLSSRTILMKQAGGAIGLLRKAVALQGEYLRGLEREDMYALATVETAVGDLGPAPASSERHRRHRFGWWGKHADNNNNNKHNNKSNNNDDDDDEGDGPPGPPRLTKEEKAAQALRTTINAMRELAGKMQQEIRFAKRDAARGKLTAHDLSEIVQLLRYIFIPVTGMSTIMDIFRRTAEHRGWNEVSDDPNDDEAVAKEKERRVWNEIMKQLREPFALLSEAIDEGLEHAGLQLDLLPKTKEQKAKDKAARKARKASRKESGGSGGGSDDNSSSSSSGNGGNNKKDSNDEKRANGSNEASNNNDEGKTTSPPSPSSPPSDDVEARGDLLKPGDTGFAAVIDAKVKRFYNTRGEVLRVWARERGLLDEDTVPLPTGRGRGPSVNSAPAGLDPVFMPREDRQAQLYVLLYMEQLMIATGEAVQDFVKFADKKVADGTMDKKRFLLPTLRRLRKWVISVFDAKDETNEGDDEVMKPNFNVVFLGDSYNERKDPEHLPPTTAWERFGNGLRAVSGLLGSPESMFGLRVACATMTVAILCFLRSTQIFFQEQRLMWAMIIIVIGMTQTSGQSLFGFICRVGGSALAMVFSYIIWYIVDQKTPGIIVFLWLFMFCEYYFFIKYPRFIAATMITIVTQVLILGYELQVRKIGIALAESNGQRYYPTYELAPYRLAAVSAGCLVAFFWTVFPSPTTDRAWLRRDLSATLYLLANYFSVINETLKTTMYGRGGDAGDPGNPAHKLVKVRQKLHSKLLLLLPSLQLHADWQKWEPTIGGRFPRAAYEDIILRCGRILNYLSLIAYTVTWKPQHAPPRHDDDAWLRTLGDLIRNLGPTHYTILSTLTLLSNSMLSGQSLPPYIPLPRPYELTRQLLGVRRRPAPSDGAANSSGGGGGKSQVQRRNSIWRRPSWRSSQAGHDNPAGGGGGVGSTTATAVTPQGLYERQDEEGNVLSSLPGAGTTTNNTARRRTNTSALGDRPNWHDLADNEVSTATGAATLMRIPTRTATSLGAALDARNMEQHGYTEFAVLQVCSTLICDDLEGMIQAVSGLVGVVDFSFRVDDSVGDSIGDAASTTKGKGKKD